MKTQIQGYFNQKYYEGKGTGDYERGIVRENYCKLGWGGDIVSATDTISTDL